MPVKKPTTIKLRIGDQETIHKIQVEMSDDPNSLISLKKLKRDCDNKRANALSGENANQDEQG